MTPDRLLTKLYLDEDVSVLLAELLRSHGVDVVTARDALTLGNSDESQLEFAINQGRAIVTHNRLDFKTLHRNRLAAQQSHTGILIANRRPSTAELARRVMKLLRLVSPDDMRDQLLYL